jgi:DNA-binding transcriptional MerR regulator
MLFKAGENERLYYSVTEVAEMLQVNSSTLRYWETEFDFIKPKRNKKGKRFYTATDIEKLRMVHQLLKEKGYTLKGAREFLKSKDQAGIDRHSEVTARLRQIKQTLINLRESL